MTTKPPKKRAINPRIKKATPAEIKQTKKELKAIAARPAKRGRPTGYKPEHCEHVVEHMSKGKTLTSWTARIECSRSAPYIWAKKYPEFFDALDLGHRMAAEWWENLLQEQASGENRGNLQATVFWMKNRFQKDWRDKVEQEMVVRHKPMIIEKLNGDQIVLGQEEIEDGSIIPGLDI